MLGRPLTAAFPPKRIASQERRVQLGVRGLKAPGVRDASLEVDQGWARGELQAFPDLHMTVVKTVTENDLVTILWIFRGTHARSGYGGLPPTGTPMEFRGITIFRIVDGRIVEEWTSFDIWSAYSQALQHLRWWIIAAVGLLLLASLYIGHLVFKWLGRSRRPIAVG